MVFSDFVLKLEEVISAVVRAAAPLSWDEDHITYSLLSAVRTTLNGAHIVGLHRPCKFAAQAYKLRGTGENLYGDIAVLVRLTSWDSEVLEGVGFLEAKKRSLAPPTFEAFKIAQARRITRSASRAQLLLYDSADITGFADNIPLLIHPYGWFHFLVPKTHALCTPLSTAVHVGRCTPSLYKYGLPLSIQLACRFLRAIDLEFGTAPLAAAQGAAEVAGGVKYVLSVGVSLADEGEPVLPEVRANVYDVLRETAA